MRLLALCLGGFLFCAPAALTAQEGTGDAASGERPAAAATATPDAATVPPEVATLLAQATAACEAVRSATYSARLAFSNSAETAPTVKDGLVRWRKWPAPASRQDTDSQLRADLRLDVRGGPTYAFVDEDLSLFDHDIGQELVVTKSQGAERWITGNIIGETVRTALLDPGLFTQFAGPGATLRHVGSEEVEGVLCDVLLSSAPGDDIRQDIRLRYWLGVDDHLPRRFEQSVIKGGARSLVTVTLSGLLVDEPLPDSDFDIETPEGYRVVAYEPPPQPKTLAIGSRAPDWTLLGPDGKKHSLSDYRGKILVMDFWATWCVPCLEAMPGLQKLHEDLPVTEVAILGVSSFENADSDPAGFMEDKGFTYPLLLNGEDITDDYTVTGFPTVYVIDRDGTVLYVEDGFYEGMAGVIGGVVRQAL